MVIVSSFSAAERPFGRGHLVGRTRIDRDRRAQRPRQALEAGFDDVMIVGAVKRGDVQRHAAVHREVLEPLLHELGVEAAYLVAHELGLEHQERPAGNVDRDARERLIHRHMDVGVARDALHVPERLLHCLTECDADVLRGVMMIDVQVALSLDREVDAGMARQKLEHVIEEADPRRGRRRTGTVKVDRDLHVAFLGATLDRALAHEWVLRNEPRAFYQGLTAFANLTRPHLRLHPTMLKSCKRHSRMQPTAPDPWHGTTVLTVRKGGSVVIGGDGQVSIGQTIVKANAKKVRRLGKGDVIGGFAGATADAFTLFERLEAKLEQYPGQLTRAAVELAKDWRTDRYLRRLEAMMIVADAQVSLVLTGTGDVLEPEAGVMGIGSGGNYALAAARAMMDGPLDAEAIVRKAMDIAADICVYTNRNVTIEMLKSA